MEISCLRTTDICIFHRLYYSFTGTLLTLQRFTEILETLLTLHWFAETSKTLLTLQRFAETLETL